jgi:hypothetical protein
MRKRSVRRRGAATLEIAVCLVPLMFMFGALYGLLYVGQSRLTSTLRARRAAFAARDQPGGSLAMDYTVTQRGRPGTASGRRELGTAFFLGTNTRFSFRTDVDTGTTWDFREFPLAGVSRLSYHGESLARLRAPGILPLRQPADALSAGLKGIAGAGS